MRSPALLLLCACHRAPPEAPPERVAAPALDPDAPLGRGQVQVRLADPQSVHAVEIECPSGFRARVSLSPHLGGTEGVGRLDGVPDEPCKLWFKGGTPAAYEPVLAGQDLRCAIASSTAVCARAR